MALALVGVLTVNSGCTDKRQKPVTHRSVDNSQYTNVGEIGDIIWRDQTGTEYDLTAVSMTMRGSMLYVTGYPFGFATWDVGAEPENPRLLGYAARDLQNFSPDPPFGGWTVNYFGLGGILSLGNLVYSSGQAGLSVINVSSVVAPQEVERFPRPDSRGEQAQDIAYMYKAMVANPQNASIVYGFSETDKVYTLGVSGNRLNIMGANAYSNSGNVCCVMGATSFAGNIFVAMRSYLWRLGVSGSSLQSMGTVGSGINPVNVVSTSRFLYVQHNPVAGSGSSMSPGIYVFDRNGQSVNYLPITPVNFVVHPNDTHVYANLDDLSVKIYRIQW